MGKLKQDHVGPWVWELCGAITSPRTEGQEEGVIT